MEKIKKQEGFTLLEVIMAISILTVGILSVATMQASSIRGNAFAWGTSEASTVAMGQIERLMDLAYTDAQLTAGNHVGVPEGRYNPSWTVTDNAIINQTKTINVIITWTDRGISRNVTIPFVFGKKSEA
jgi:type IV pilus assembly protein PilV